MSKVLKILFIMFIFSLVCFTISYGVNTTNEENIASNTISEENSSLEESLINENYDISTDDTTYDGTSNHYESEDNQTTTSSSYTVSSVNDLPESSLSVHNILNLVIIVLGILLILLAIAILIRLKK